MLKLTTNEKNLKEEASLDLDELAREGAKRMILEALHVEVAKVRRKTPLPKRRERSRLGGKKR